MLSPQALKVRKRLLNDFSYYAAHSLYIRTKAQKVELFHPNEAQRRLIEVIERQLDSRGYVRIIILKGRQMGLSTVVAGWLYWWVSQRAAQKALVVAHKADASQTLFDMTRRFHKMVPDILRPSTEYASGKRLAFDKLDSSYTVVTAGGDAIGRSETITAAHISELAFWPPNSAQESFSGLMDTIPPGPGTAVFIESTANGVSGLFYDQWQKAIKGESDFEPIFLPWFIEPSYTAPVPEMFSMTPKEIALAEKFGLTPGQLMFRRLRIAEKGEDLFKQEYPCDAQEAFLTSGRPVFNVERVQTMLSAAPKPLARLGYEGSKWVPDAHGELLCYLKHDPAETYFVGADVGAGVNKDFSVAQVFTSNREQAAILRGQFDPDYFGTLLAALGRFYNDAWIICERNNHGILTNRVLARDEEYPNVFRETIYDKITDTETQQVGFFTSEKSKPLIIDKLRANVRLGEIKIYDETTLEEMRSFIVAPTGRMAGEKGTHDDCVMALAMCNHINTGPWQPIENQESWYLTGDY